MDAKEFALKEHERWQGKLEISLRCKVESMEDLSVAYTPGVAQPCLAIRKIQNFPISIHAVPILLQS